MRQNGSIESGPAPFTFDIIDAMISHETANLVSPIPTQTSAPQDLKLSKFSGGFINQYQNQQTLELPLKNLNRMSDCTDILRDDSERKCESMFCVEFDVRDVLRMTCEINEMTEKA